MIRTPKPIGRHPLENTVTVTLSRNLLKKRGPKLSSLVTNLCKGSECLAVCRKMQIWEIRELLANFLSL